MAVWFNCKNIYILFLGKPFFRVTICSDFLKEYFRKDFFSVLLYLNKFTSIPESTIKTNNKYIGFIFLKTRFILLDSESFVIATSIATFV